MHMATSFLLQTMEQIHPWCNFREVTPAFGPFLETKFMARIVGSSVGKEFTGDGPTIEA